METTNLEQHTYIKKVLLNEYRENIDKAVLKYPKVISELESLGFSKEKIGSIKNITDFNLSVPEAMKETSLPLFAQLWQFSDVDYLCYTDDTLTTIDKEESLSYAEALCTRHVNEERYSMGYNAILNLKSAIKEVTDLGLGDILGYPFGLGYNDEYDVSRTYNIKDLIADDEKQLREKLVVILKRWCNGFDD